MNKKLFFVLGLAAIVATASAGNYNFDDDFQKCVNQSDSLCDGSSANNGSCTLYQSFQNISVQLSVNWTASDKTAYNAFLAQIQIILSSTTYSNTEKYILVSGQVDKFAASNPTCYKTFQYFNITSIANVNMMQKIVIVKQQETVQSTIILDSSSNCPLFDALRAAASATGNSSCISAVEEAINDKLIPICSNSSSNVSEQIVSINQEIQQLLVQYSSLQVQIQTTQIASFGYFEQFFKCATTFQQQSQVAFLFSGTYPNIPIITYLQAALNATPIGASKVAMSVFFQRVNSTLSNASLTYEQRQIMFSNIVEEWTSIYYSSTTTVVYSAQIGSFGSVWDFCFLSACPEVTQIPIPVFTDATTESTSPSSESTTVLSSTVTGCTCTCSTGSGETD